MNTEAKQARREYYAEYRTRNSEKLKEYKRKWRAKNPDKVVACQERYWTKRAAQSAASRSKTEPATNSGT